MLLPFLKRLNQEQMKEKIIEAEIQGILLFGNYYVANLNKHYHIMIIDL